MGDTRHRVMRHCHQDGVFRAAFEIARHGCFRVACEGQLNAVVARNGLINEVLLLLFRHSAWLIKREKLAVAALSCVDIFLRADVSVVMIITSNICLHNLLYELMFGLTTLFFEIIFVLLRKTHE